MKGREFLKQKITSKREAIEYIFKLADNNLDYHLDNDATDIVFNDHIRMHEKVAMNKRNGELDKFLIDKHKMCLEILDLDENKVYSDLEI